MNKILPFNKIKILSIIKKYPTPFYLYDEIGIRRSARELNEAFSWSKGFRNYFAVLSICIIPKIFPSVSIHVAKYPTPGIGIFGMSI